MNIVNLIKDSPGLEKSYYLYRFIWDDDFLEKLKIGDIYTEKGFLSTTRDPFYSPGIDQNFGLILIKIHIPKKIKGLGLFIENFSMFPKEEEFLIPPYSKLKLLSRDDKFKYHHTNQMSKGNILYKKAKKIILGGNMLLSKRPEMILPELWPVYFAKAKKTIIGNMNI